MFCENQNDVAFHFKYKSLLKVISKVKLAIWYTESSSMR